MNEFEQTCNEEPTFEVHGHDVTIVSPALARIAIRCPFPPSPTEAEVPLEHQQFIAENAAGVVNYLLREGFFGETCLNVGVIVETEHV